MAVAANLFPSPGVIRSNVLPSIDVTILIAAASQESPRTAASATANTRTSRDAFILCPTSKMSHDGTWRASCRITNSIPSFHFGITLHRTRRDKSRRWLWRLVGPMSIRKILPAFPNTSLARNRTTMVEHLAWPALGAELPLANYRNRLALMDSKHRPSLKSIPRRFSCYRRFGSDSRFWHPAQS